MEATNSTRKNSLVRILIAADDPTFAQAMSIRLQNHNQNWDIADICLSGRETIEKSNLLHPDLILFDFNIRGISGFDVITLVRENNPSAKFIVFTQNKDLNNILMALRLGISDYFFAPINQEALINSIERISNVIASEKKAEEDNKYLQERMGAALRMIKKDYIQLLVKSDSTQLRKLISISNFLGIEELPGFMIAILQQKDKPSFQLPETVIYRLSTEYEIIGTSIQPGLSVSFLSTPVNVEEAAAYRRKVIQSLNNLLISYAKDGEQLIGSAGSIDVGALQMKNSLLEALTALKHYGAVPSPYQQCIIYDSEKMPLPGSGTPNKFYSAVEESSDTMSQAINYINQNYQHFISLNDVANNVNLSPYYFCHAFKKYTGSTFSQYLQELRINKAKELLADKDNTVKKVAYLVGYNDPNYFSKVFHSVTGIKANEYYKAKQ